MRVLIADDHDLVRETLAAYLLTEGMALVRTAPNLPQALEEVQSTGPFDLVLLDFNMPGMNGIAGLRRMIEANGGKPVAILSGSASRDVAEAALNAGAAGFVPKSLASRSVVMAVRHMAAGEIYAPFRLPDADEAPAEEAPQTLLTRREGEVLRGLMLGEETDLIGRRLGLEEVTVRLLVRTLCRKIGASDRDTAVRIARERGLPDLAQH